MISVADKLKCIERELGLRKRAYPRFVVQGKMTAEKAEREIAIMAEIAADYETLAKQMDMFER
jgi:hypothetical protein